MYNFDVLFLVIFAGSFCKTRVENFGSAVSVRKTRSASYEPKLPKATCRNIFILVSFIKIVICFLFYYMFYIFSSTLSMISLVSVLSFTTFSNYFL